MQGSRRRQQTTGWKKTKIHLYWQTEIIEMSESRGRTQVEAESDTIVDAIETVTASERAAVCALIMYAYYTSRKHLTNNCIWFMPVFWLFAHQKGILQHVQQQQNAKHISLSFDLPEMSAFNYACISQRAKKA